MKWGRGLVCFIKKEVCLHVLYLENHMQTIDMADLDVDQELTIDTERKAPSVAVGGPWSSFHSSITLSAARGPGTPIRQQPSTSPLSQRASAVTEMKEHFTELDLLVEYKLLCLNYTRGVYVLPSSKSLYEWHGVIFIHSGPFKGGVFRFTMYIPDGFPKQRPMLRFHSKIFHPYIHASNRVLNMLRAFPSWDPVKHHLWHIIQYTQDCFYNAETWQECNLDVFVTQAQVSALESLKNVYDPVHVDDEDGNLIRFSQYDEKQYIIAMQTLQQGNLPMTKQSGTSQSMLSNVTGHVKQLWDRMVTR